MIESAPGDPAAPPPFVEGPAPGPPLFARLVALVEVVLCSGFPTQLVLIVVLHAAGLSPLDNEGRLSTVFVATLSLVDTVLVIGLATFFLASHRESIRDVFVGRRPLAGEAALGVLLVPAAFAGVVLIIGAIRLWVPSLHNVARNPLEDLLLGPGGASVFLAVLVLAGGLREEVQRAFILHRFEGYLGGGPVGLVLFSAAFGLGHLDQGRDVALTTACLGLFWGWIYLRRRSMVAPAVCHAGFNLVEAIRFLMAGG
jgi:membrane protease YdiL (CAAX protease family)